MGLGIREGFDDAADTAFRDVAGGVADAIESVAGGVAGDVDEASNKGS